jgi:hypothetical protein
VVGYHQGVQQRGSLLLSDMDTAHYKHMHTHTHPKSPLMHSHTFLNLKFSLIVTCLKESCLFFLMLDWNQVWWNIPLIPAI